MQKKPGRKPVKVASAQQKTPEQLALQKSFGDRIRELRTDRGWSQEHFADNCDIDRSHMGELERGEVDPQLSTIAKIVKGLTMLPGGILNPLFPEVAVASQLLAPTAAPPSIPPSSVPPA